MHHQPAFTCMLTYFVPCVGADLSAEKFLHANGSLAGHTPALFSTCPNSWACPPGRWFSSCFTGLEENRMGDFTLYVYMYTL